MSKWGRLLEGLRWLAAEFSCTPDEFRRANQPEGNALLDGLGSQGFIVSDKGRIAVSERGHRALELNQPSESEND